MSRISICPTITAFDDSQYKEQMERIKSFSKRVHIDLMDGQFSETRSPDLSHVWWPEELVADVHLMYRNPMDYLEQLIKLKPNLVVIHYEAQGDHLEFAKALRSSGVKVGLACLHDTPVESLLDIVSNFDHALIFSGHLGHHGGEADLALLPKVRLLKQSNPEVEIGWDGGVNDSNAPALVDAGVSVLNVGGYIQNSSDPQGAYAKIEESISEA